MEKRKYSPRREGQYKLSERLASKRRRSSLEWIIVRALRLLVWTVIAVGMFKMVYDLVVGF